MCKGFGGIVTQDGRVLFCEPDTDGNCSHSDLLERLGMKDNDDQHLRHFVRFEFPDWKPESFRWDEDDTLPGWVMDEHEAKCKSVLARVAPAWAEYEKVRDTAWTEFEKVRDTAWTEYEKVCAPAWAEYEKVRDTAWTEYEKVRAPAWAEFVKHLSTITGYVPEAK